MTRKNYGWIDGLKGISILLVVMLHTGGEVLPGYLGNIVGDGGHGVQMFFLISAFLSYQSLEYYFSDKDYNFVNIICWIGKKILRLFLLYYLGCFLSIILVGGVPFWYGTNDYLSVGNIVSHLTFTHGLFPEYCNSFIGVEWYIGALMVFYVLSPLLYKVNNGLAKSIFWFVLSLALSIVLIYYATIYMPDEIHHVYFAYVDTFWFITQLPVYMMGIILYFIFKKGIVSKDYKGKKAIGVILFIVGTGLSVFEACTTIQFFRDYTIVLYGVWFAIVFLSFGLLKNYVVDNPVLRMVGKYSYGIYLLHPVIYRLYEQIPYVQNINASPQLKWLMEFSFTVIVGFVISFVLIKFIDTPLQKLFKSIGKKEKQ